MSLAHRTVALAEGRQLEDLVQLLDKEQATSLRYPLLAILDPVDDTPALAWLDDLAADRFDWAVFMTGEGIRRLLKCAERHGRRDEIVAALGRVTSVTRGPKPGKALAEIGLKPTHLAAAPTTAGVLKTLTSLPVDGKSIGVQLYPGEHPELPDHLTGRGCTVKTVLPYRYAPASDADRVAELIGDLAEGRIDVAVFTSSPQVDRLFAVAEENGTMPRLQTGLARTKVAVVGPIVADNFRERSVRVDICPEQGWQMKNLVIHMKRAFEGV
jgi:uroporphyrinogen-III synthase